MHDELDDELHTHARRWASRQVAPPPLTDAVRRAAVHGHRGHVVSVATMAVAATAVVAVAGVPLARTLGTGSAGAVSDPGGPRSVLVSRPAQAELSELSRLAGSAADANHDPHATAEAVSSTYDEAASLVLGGDQSPTLASRTRVWVVQLDGTFTCTQCSVPPGASPPTGRHLVLIVDAGSYQLYDETVSDQVHDLSSIGTAVQLPL